jgi:DNA-binding NarL/FixJ family response regulator
MKQIRVLLADDQTLFRAGLQCLINQIEGFHVYAEGPCEIKVMEQVAQCQPDIVAFGINADWAGGIALIGKLRQRCPDMGIILLTTESSEQCVIEAFQSGVSAYLLKTADPAQLEVALKAVASNESYLSPDLSSKVIRRFAAPSLILKNPLQTMTTRQLQILTMIGYRKGIKQIAHELSLSPKTIAAHRTKIMERTGEKDTVGLVLYARKFGLSKSDD